MPGRVAASASNAGPVSPSPRGHLRQEPIPRSSGRRVRRAVRRPLAPRQQDRQLEQPAGQTTVDAAAWRLPPRRAKLGRRPRPACRWLRRRLGARHLPSSWASRVQDLRPNPGCRVDRCDLNRFDGQHDHPRHCEPDRKQNGTSPGGRCRNRRADDQTRDARHWACLPRIRTRDAPNPTTSDPTTADRMMADQKMDAPTTGDPRMGDRMTADPNRDRYSDGRNQMTAGRYRRLDAQYRRLDAPCPTMDARCRTTTGNHPSRPKAARNPSTVATNRRPVGRRLMRGDRMYQNSLQRPASRPTSEGSPAWSPRLRSRSDRGQAHWGGRYRSAMNQMKKGEAWRQPIGRGDNAPHPLHPGGQRGRERRKDAKRRKDPLRGPFCLRNPAASYSPRESPPKYHRRWWA